MKKFILLILTAIVFTCSCGNSNRDNNQSEEETSNLKGKLVIFHAGSLSYPVKAICDSFKVSHPQVEILTEAAGSKDCARKISDLGKRCDIMLSADYKVIDNLLIPEWADWNIKFASNEMSIVFTDRSKYAADINKYNWYNILLKDDVIYGRSDPESDPCGVRSLLTMMLAEDYYNIPGLSKKMEAKDKNYIRPKETDLIALLEAKAVDYIFLYRSVAQQHNLKYLLLPDSVNLRNEALGDYYGTVSVETTGKKPGEKIRETGSPMIYGLTIPKSCENEELALAFLEFFLQADGGMAIMEASGQPSVVPAICEQFNKVPEKLKKFALPPKN
ncbi:MAG TPA: extracellular solute-binding protein [Bacteroidales bacterium]|jgi:molybdate/tungstate transport system substrate-binding protein|nr:extracellular solute-binding protein [Bacteroidales bacterium]HNZ41900.1 extracellular solute-binding protein [Bacteroidales bacterium]HOH83396.1 extracellular solute-binding protein [Bacteroidales bacterium]HPB25811.1 extracellular solute-binding protein [Bacteroidales bacterium]HPI29454.1 extracellular solute-binding protein [Bacteroidales bacterium]